MKISIGAVVCLGSLSLSLVEEVVGVNGLPVVNNRALPVVAEGQPEARRSNMDGVPSDDVPNASRDGLKAANSPKKTDSVVQRIDMTSPKRDMTDAERRLHNPLTESVMEDDCPDEAEEMPDSLQSAESKTNDVDGHVRKPGSELGTFATSGSSDKRALQKKEEDPLRKAGQILAELYFQFMIATSSAEPTELSPIPGAGDGPMITPPNWIEFLNVDMQQGRVAIEIITAGEGDIVQGVIEELSSYGFELIATYRHTACGTIPVIAIPNMCTCENLIFARPVISKTNTVGSGSVISEGGFSLQADLLQSPPYNLSGDRRRP
jgi:hypothetical protein